MTAGETGGSTDHGEVWRCWPPSPIQRSRLTTIERRDDRGDVAAWAAFASASSEPTLTAVAARAVLTQQSGVSLELWVQAAAVLSVGLDQD
ncbi:hypothetical protein ACFYT3_09805 [Nocardia amikacinitolerans]|uniref:hypothetical protein n=1 Tax=Nocardia amikacinitolerans TaxID=756689 RepID=UPI0036BB704B